MINLRKGISLIALLCGIFLQTGCDRDANQIPQKMIKIGVLSHAPVADPSLEGLKQQMATFGYEEGKNIQYFYQGAIFDQKKLLLEAQQLVRDEVDLLYTLSTPATLIAQKVSQGTKIPVIFAPASSPVGAGIVTTMQQPGGKTTGVTFGLQEAKRLEWLKKISPSIKKVYFPYNPQDRSPSFTLQQLRKISGQLGIEFVLGEARSKDEVLQLLQNIPTEIDAIFISTDALVSSFTADFGKIALDRKIPLTVPHREGVIKGVLFSYGFSILHLGKQAARLVDQVIKGTSPSELPVELTEFYLAINLNTAESIHLPISDETIRQALVIRK